MATLTLTVQLEYDAETMHGDSYEECQWFIDSILGLGGNSRLHLFSDEVGDVIGEVTVLAIADKQVISGL